MLKNGILNIGGAAIRTGLALLAIPLLIRLIGIEEYGLWILVSAVIGFVTLAEGGLSTTTTVFLARDLGNEDANGATQTVALTLGATFFLATAAALALWLSSKALVGFFPSLGDTQREVAVQGFRIGALVIWLRLLQQVLIGVEQAHQRYGIMNLLATGQAALSTLGLLAVAWVGGRTLAMMEWQAATSIASLAAHMIVAWVLVRKMTTRSAWNWRKGFDIARYSLTVWASSLGVFIYGQADRLIVGAILGTTTLGVYAAITGIAAQISSLSAMPVQPVLPVLSKWMADGDKDQLWLLRRQVKQAQEFNALAALGVGAVLFTLAQSVMRTVIPTAFIVESTVAYRIAVLIYTLSSLNAVGYYILFGTKRAQVYVGVQLFAAILSLGLIGLGASAFGLIGAIAGNAPGLVVLLAIPIGIRRLGIELRAWLGWLSFPFGWFVAIVLVNTLIPDQLTFSIPMLLLESLLLLAWFLITQNDNKSAIRARGGDWLGT